MSLSGMEVAPFLPNLPGYRTKALPSGFKKSQFQLVDGMVFLKDDVADLQSSQTMSLNDEESTTLSVGSPGKKKISIKDIGKVLNFSAYFEERPDGLPADAKQVRKCNIYYYLEDESVKVIEKPQLNSGVSQGKLVRRAVVNKPDGFPLTPLDFRFGDYVTIYGRSYRIVDCDNATKRFLMENYGIDEFIPLPVPDDNYQKYRSTLQAGLDDSWGKFHSRKNDSKTFNDAVRGVLADNTGREGFIKYGNRTLKFKCLWDNTHNLYGDVLTFALSYYLADDTVEVVAVPGPQVSTSDANKQKLLKRSKLPKDYVNTRNLGERLPPTSFLHWTEIYIGMELDLYGRRLQICDADTLTRRFFNEHNFELGSPIVQPEPEIMVHKREIPPPTGFGSEEDSMRSVSGSLMPGPVPAKKLGENKMLSFFCSLLSGGIDDVERRFVITFYVTDNTIKVIEPPVRNSGFSGGVFLSRREVKSERGELIKYEDLFIGCKLKVLKHVFLLLDASESTLKWMEDQGLSLPRSNYFAVMDKIRPTLFNDANNGKLYNLFQQMETQEDGPAQAKVETLRTIFKKYNLMSDHPDDISEHELRTILRGAGNKKVTFDYGKMIEQIIQPTDEYK